MDIAGDIKRALSLALSKQHIAIAPEDIKLEHPAEFVRGDYATGAALRYAKQAGVSSRTLAENIAVALGEIKGVAKIEVAGAGFINFHLAPAVFSAALEEARTEEKWGKNAALAGKKIMVEYTDPNPFKEFHIGHLMSNAIGESIARLLQFSGAEVKRACYQGDVGLHVAKALWKILRDQVGTQAPTAAIAASAYVDANKLYEEDSNVRAEIDEINKKIYSDFGSSPAINTLYTIYRKVSLEHFAELYKILGTEFDHNFFESASAPKGLEIVRAHPEVFVESDGAIVYKGEQDGLHTRVFITSKGLPTYETKELGLAELKAEAADFDVSITVTAHEQSDYFAVVLAAMRRVLPAIAQKILHISHGMMRFAEGKMSSRTGNVITGESLLADLTEAAKVRAAESRAEDPNALAQQIAVGAIKYQILKQASGKDIIFDRERALSLEGDSGPYLQYAHARAQQVVERANSEGVTLGIKKGDAFKVPESANELVRLLHRFPEAVEYAASELEPHLLTNYLLAFASAFNHWYAIEHILDGTPAAAHKVALADAARRTLKNGLWVLGIPAPEKM